MTYKQLSKKICRVRYGKPGEIIFDFNKGGNNKTFFIKEPKDILLVGQKGAKMWIARNYSFLLI